MCVQTEYVRKWTERTNEMIIDEAQPESDDDCGDAEA